MPRRNVLSLCVAAGCVVALACSPTDATYFEAGTSTRGTPTAVGRPSQQFDSRAFIWSPEGGLREIPPPPGAEGMWVTGINDRGEVVGFVTMRSGTEDFRAFMWSEASGYKSLGSLVGPEGISVAFAVNDSGTVTGLSDGPSSNLNTGMNILLNDGFVWTAASGISKLGPVPGLISASLINNAGTMIGYGQNGMFLWNPTSGAKSLALPAGTDCSAAYDLNDNSQVLGFAGTHIGGRCTLQIALVWDVDGSVVRIETCVPKYQSDCAIYIKAINNRGEVIGARDGAGAFRWTRAGGFVGFPVAGDTFGQDINDLGDVAGMSFDVRSQTSSPFLWMASGEVKKIPLLPGSTSAWPVAINGKRQVVGNFR